jgi:hypothetical protein
VRAQRRVAIWIATARARALLLVEESPGLTVRELADEIGWAPVNVWRLLVRPLEAEGRLRRRDGVVPVELEVVPVSVP